MLSPDQPLRLILCFSLEADDAVAPRRRGLVPTSVSPGDPAAGGVADCYSLIVILLPGPSNGKSLSKIPFSIATHPAVGVRS